MGCYEFNNCCSFSQYSKQENSLAPKITPWKTSSGFKSSHKDSVPAGISYFNTVLPRAFNKRATQSFTRKVKTVMKAKKRQLKKYCKTQNFLRMAFLSSCLPITSTSTLLILYFFHKILILLLLCEIVLSNWFVSLVTGNLIWKLGKSRFHNRTGVCNK